MRRLEDKVALVTGAGRGFGRTIAISLAEEGAKVVGVSRTRSELEDTAGVIKSGGGEILTIPTDLSSIEEIHRMVDTLLENYGRLDILYNNAGNNHARGKKIDEVTVEEWDYTIAVNLRAPFILAKAFLETMKGEGGGSIINVSSRSSELGFVAEIVYCPSKFGLEGLTQCMAIELKPYNIAVNSLRPSAPPGSTLKPGGMTLDDLKKMPREERTKYADDESMIRAYKDAWVFLAMQNGKGITGGRFVVSELAEHLENHGWEKTVSDFHGKLTKAEYVTYDIPQDP
jgi:NAD(P)-dependent dehydrogenase (short-subunit alcohol dehydrogenase family)